MIDTGAGVIDADYRGIVFVLLFNHSDKDFQGNSDYLAIIYLILTWFLIVEEGDRIAQLIIEKIQTPEVMEVQVIPACKLSCVPCLNNATGSRRNASWRSGIRFNWRTWVSLRIPSWIGLFNFIRAASMAC
jgi:hypothetical protein